VIGEGAVVAAPMIVEPHADTARHVFLDTDNFFDPISQMRFEQCLADDSACDEAAKEEPTPASVIAAGDGTTSVHPRATASTRRRCARCPEPRTRTAVMP